MPLHTTSFVFPFLPRRFVAGFIDFSVMLGVFPLIAGCMAMAQNVQDARVMESSPTMALMQWGGFILVFAWIYTVAMECSEKQATLGKQAMKIKVVDEQGAPLDPAKSSLRFVSSLGTILFAGLPMIGCLNGRGQSYFERWNKTMVVHCNATVADMRHKRQVYTTKGWWGTMIFLVLLSSLMVNTVGPVAEQLDTAYRMHRTQNKADEVIAAVRSHQSLTGEWPAHLRDVNHTWHNDQLDVGEDAEVKYTPGKITYAWKFESMEGQKTEVEIYPILSHCKNGEPDLAAESPIPCRVGHGG